MKNVLIPSGIRNRKIFVFFLLFLIGCHANAAKVQFKEGVAHITEGDLDEAIVNFTEAIKNNPNYAEAYYYRGNAFHDKKDNNKTIEDYSKAIDINWEYADAYYSRGISFYENGYIDKAIEDPAVSEFMTQKFA